MEIYYIDKTKNCNKYTFNGSIIIEDQNNLLSNNVPSLRDRTIINVYRSTDNLSESTIMYKKISRLGVPLTQGEILFEIKKTGCISGWREDPRIFVVNQKLLISYTFVKKKKNQIRSVKIKYCSLNKNLKPRREIHLIYGNNDKNLINKLCYWEKNWLFFPHKDDLLVIYSLNPLIIFNSNNNQCIKKYQWVHKLNYKWKNFEIRGGAPPILLENKYYFFAHTHDNLTKGIYDLIVIILNMQLDIIGYTDPINLYINKKIVYPSGAIYIQDERKFIISCGIDDNEQILLFMTYDRLQKLLHFIY